MSGTDNKTLGGDSRLKKTTEPDSHMGRDHSDEERTGKDGTVFSAAERVSNFRDEWTANALPNPPDIPGYHTCWLSTTNNYDPIHKRMRMGYTPVSAMDVPGFEPYKMKSGEFEGMVSCNEMLLFKIPQSLYQEMMSYFHHEKPLEEEQMLKQNQALTDAQATDVAKAEDDGFKQLAARRSAPIFH